MRTFPAAAVQCVLRCDALLVALERFSKDEGVLADPIHLQEEQPSKVGPETTLEFVRRAIWGMLYADDACSVSRSPRGLWRMMAVFVEVFGTFGSTIISENKTETMCMPIPHALATNAVFSLCMESTSYVLSFQMVFFYLLTTAGWIFYISLRENSINQFNQQSIVFNATGQ